MHGQAINNSPISSMILVLSEVFVKGRVAFTHKIGYNVNTASNAFCHVVLPEEFLRYAHMWISE